MAKISLPYTIVNGDPVDAGPVESNYKTIENHANQELIERGGTVAMTGQLKLVGNPVAALDAAPKQYVDVMIPIGGIMMFAGSTVPTGGQWLLCDGAEYQATTYPALAAVIGAASGRFNVPNLVDRFAVGAGGVYPNKSQGGSPDAIVPVHTHPMDHAHVTDDTNIDHHHGGIDHLHNAGGLTANAVGDHQHSGDSGPLMQALGAGITLGEGGTLAAYTGWSSTSPAGAHGHSLSGYTANADRDLTTGWMDVNKAHGHTVREFKGNTASTGDAVAGKNLPPYYAVLYLVRAA